VTIKPIFAWYDIWIGAFWDQAKRRLYVFPIPMLGLVIQFPAKRPKATAAADYRWPGPGPAPARWTASDGTICYRSYSDYCDD
jgi:hypothetical protein